MLDYLSCSESAFVAMRNFRARIAQNPELTAYVYAKQEEQRQILASQLLANSLPRYEVVNNDLLAPSFDYGPFSASGSFSPMEVTHDSENGTFEEMFDYVVDSTQLAPEPEPEPVFTNSPFQPLPLPSYHASVEVDIVSGILEHRPLEKKKQQSTASKPSEKTHICDRCARSFARAHDLVRHYRLHTGDEPFECYGCNKRWKRSDARKRHWRLQPECCKRDREIAKVQREETKEVSLLPNCSGRLKSRQM